MQKIQSNSVTLLSQLQNPNGTTFTSSTKRGTHTTNDVSDIIGAQVPQRETRIGIDRPHFHEPSDIAGSSSRTLHPKDWRKSSEKALDPREKKFNTTRVVDPLNPTYNLPSFEVATFVRPYNLNWLSHSNVLAGTEISAGQYQRSRYWWCICQKEKSYRTPRLYSGEKTLFFDGRYWKYVNL